MPLIAVAAISAIGSAVAANQQKKAAEGAANAAQVNIDALNQKTKDITSQNAIDSQNLFKQLNPAAYGLQQSGTAGLQASLGGNQYLKQAQDLLGQHLSQNLNDPTLSAAIAKARSDLSLGGKLDPETQNLVTRSALANTGSVAQGAGGTGLGRDITARDLGLTSLNLQNTRLANASTLGGQEMQQSQLNNQNFLGNVGALSSLNSNNFQQYLAAAGLGNQLAQNSPQIGLSGSSVANIQQGNQNAQAQGFINNGSANAGLAQGLGNAAGQAIGAYGVYNGSPGFNSFQQANGGGYSFGPTGTGYGGGYGYGPQSSQYGMFASGAPSPSYQR